MSLTLRQIRYFLAVAETGKMVLAASHVGVSQSSITEAVKALEESMGVPLLRRHRSGVTLTHEGYQFLRHARNVTSAVADASHAVKRSLTRVAGSLTVGVTYTVAGYFLPAPLERFRRAFPDIEVRLVERERGAIEKMLVRRELDLGMILVSNLRSDELEHEVLVRSRRRLWLSAHHHLLREKYITLRDLAKEPYVMLTVDEADRTALRWWRHARLKPRIVFETSSVEAVRGMVANGAGIAILSDMVYRPWSLEGDRVEARTVYDGVPSMDVGIVWKREAEMTEPAAAFVEFFNITFNNAVASRFAGHE
jgi:DNA-binding transcriptional LysR family regulator